MTGYVYAIESGEFVKIGYAANPMRRLSELNVGSPGSHRLVGFARGTKQHERELHKLAKDERIRGEWFRKGRIVSLFLQHMPPYTPKITVKADRSAVFPKHTSSSFANTMLDGLREVSHIFSEHSGISQSVIWSRALNDPSFMKRVDAGGVFYLGEYQTAMMWFSLNWPPLVSWPDGINRPGADACRATPELAHAAYLSAISKHEPAR